jgi:hypothetical protein
MGDPVNLSTGREYEWPTERRGILAIHAEECGVRDGEPCTCGPLGYRSSLHDPITGRRVVSPMLPTEDAALAWARSPAQDTPRPRPRPVPRPRPQTLAAHDASLRVEDLIEEFLAAADDGSARDPSGRRYSEPAVEQLGVALRGHVAVELGSMPLDAVRPWQVQAFVNELSDSGLSLGRLRAIVAGLRALYGYALETGRADVNPADRIVVPAADDRPRPTDDEPRPFNTTDQLRAVNGGGNPGFIPDQMLWQLLKIVTVVFVLVALVLAAESI